MPLELFKNQNEYDNKFEKELKEAHRMQGGTGKTRDMASNFTKKFYESFVDKEARNIRDQIDKEKPKDENYSQGKYSITTTLGYSASIDSIFGDEWKSSDGKPLEYDILMKALTDKEKVDLFSNEDFSDVTKATVRECFSGLPNKDKATILMNRIDNFEHGMGSTKAINILMEDKGVLSALDNKQGQRLREFEKMRVEKKEAAAAIKDNETQKQDSKEKAASQSTQR